MRWREFRQAAAAARTRSRRHRSCGKAGRAIQPRTQASDRRH
jgi:hypothetical protein